MKKLIATICLAIGMFSTSFAENPSVNAAPSNPNVALAPEKKSDTPDVIIVVVDDRGVIVEIIVVKKR